MTHLFFADDSIIFARASLGDTILIKTILQDYEHLSGQKINVDKSEISFSKGVCRDNRTSICSLLDMDEVRRHDKYFGLPTIFDRSKKISFTGIRDRYGRSSKGCFKLSRAGKEVLIKSIIHSIPSYAMSCFKLPSSIFQEVDNITRSFWCGSHSSRGIPWKAWTFLCKPKEEGGMGFRNLEKFNLALLAKKLCRLHVYPNSFLAKTLKSKYSPNSSIWETPLGYNPSFAWKSMWSARPVLEKGCRWRIGNGLNMNIWHDAWFGLRAY